MKKVAVLADIHGNSFALEAVLEDIEKRNIDEIINLGDIFYGPLDPSKTFELLSRQNIITISGNMDRYIVEAMIEKNKNPSIILANKTLQYVLESLSNEALKWMSNLPKTLVVNNLLYLCHGSKYIDDKPLIENIEINGVYIKSDMELTKELENIKQNIILCAHTHVPQFIHLDNAKSIINPGSVGLQSYHDELPVHHIMQSYSPYSKYCVIEIEDNILVSVEHKSVIYDWKSASKTAKKNNRQDWAQYIMTGR